MSFRNFEWPWVSLSDLAKYSITRSVARSLCDSWAPCSTYRPNSCKRLSHHTPARPHERIDRCDRCNGRRNNTATRLSIFYCLLCVLVCLFFFSFIFSLVYFLSAALWRIMILYIAGLVKYLSPGLDASQTEWHLRQFLLATANE